MNAEDAIPGTCTTTSMEVDTYQHGPWAAGTSVTIKEAPNSDDSVLVENELGQETTLYLHQLS